MVRCQRQTLSRFAVTFDDDLPEGWKALLVAPARLASSLGRYLP